MNIDLENNLDKDSKKENKIGFIEEFMNAMNEVLTGKNKNNEEELLTENEKYIVRDINDEKVTAVNIENGKEIVTEKIDQSIKNDLSLGMTLYVEDGLLKVSDKQLTLENITNREAFGKLQDMFFNLEQEENEVYSVEEIKDDKIFLTSVEEGGYFSISREKYLKFKVGDLIKKKDNKYILYKENKN